MCKCMYRMCGGPSRTRVRRCRSAWAPRRAEQMALVDPPNRWFENGEVKSWDCKCMYNGMGRTMANSIAHALADGEEAGWVGDWRDGGILGQSGVG
jgi:hypothetical protein